MRNDEIGLDPAFRENFSHVCCPLVLFMATLLITSSETSSSIYLLHWATQSFQSSELLERFTKLERLMSDRLIDACSSVATTPGSAEVHAEHRLTCVEPLYGIGVRTST